MSPGSGREGRMFLGEQSGVGEGEVLPVAADDMVKNADAKNGSGLNESGCAIAILPARGGIPARMRVGADDGRTAGDYSGSEHHVGNDDARTGTALGYEIDSDQPVLVIQQKNVKLLTIDIAVQLLAREFEYLPGVAEDLPAAAKRAVANKRYALPWDAVVD